MTTKNTPLVSYDAVAATCEALTLEGVRPSVRAIIARLGGGSPNVVLDFQRQWKAGRPVVKAVDILIDPRVNQIIAEQISKSIAEATMAAEADRSEAEETLDTLSRAYKDVETRNVKLEEDLDLAISQVQTLQGQIEQLNTNVEQIKTDAVEAVNKAEALLVTERQSAENARVELAKAELRLEAVPRIEAEIEKVRAELDQERIKSANLHEQAAVAMAKLEAEITHRKNTEAQLIEMTKQREEAANRALATTEALGNERVTVQAIQGQLKAVELELAAANKVALQAKNEAQKAVEEAAELRGQLSETKKKDS